MVREVLREVSLFCAAELNEAGDSEQVHRFRIQSVPGFVLGKWFATSIEDAVAWGRAMQAFSHPRPFRVAVESVDASALTQFRYYSTLDGIGPAYFVPLQRLTLLNQASRIALLASIHDVE